LTARRISALLWVPFNLDRNGKNPASSFRTAVRTGQTVDSFSRNVIALVSRGYTVIAPNVRGSTGYGMTFQHMNTRPRRRRSPGRGLRREVPRRHRLRRRQAHRHHRVPTAAT